MKFLVLVVFTLFYYSNANSQNTNTLSLNAFLEQIKSNHPLLKQAELLDEKTKAYYQKSKGGFDPKIDGTLDHKSFDGKNYYNQIQSAFKIPTWFGADISIGYERNTGINLNQESIIPENGLLHAGINIPLGSGLIYDQRRKTLEEAKIIEKENANKKIEVYNKVLASAIKAYVNWQYNYERKLAYQNLVDNNLIRFDNIIELYNQDNAPAIDTLEIKLNLDTRKSDLLEAELEYFKSIMILNNYLWTNGNIPLELNENYVPEILPNNIWDDVILNSKLDLDEVVNNLTQLRLLDLQNEQLELERKLARENLKPTIDLKFNPLLRIANDNKAIQYNTDEYKLGAHISYPIFNRKTKGDLKIINLEVQSNILFKKNIQQEIKSQLAIGYKEIENLKMRLDINNKNVVNAETLLDAENDKFSIGESSIFLLNTREAKKLQYELKYIEGKKKLLSQKINLIEKLQLSNSIE